jgi:hypothetical protein
VSTLPDVVAVQHTAVSTGDLVLLGEIRPDEFDSLVWVGEETVRVVPLGPHDAGHGFPTLLAHPAGGVVVVRDLTHAVYVADPDAPPVPLRVEGASRLAGVAPILHGGAAVSDEARWHVVLSDGNLMGDLRYAAPLSVDLAAGVARWESPWWLAPGEFPRDLAGIPDYFERVSISSTLLRAGLLHACSPGSDIRRLHISGADYFSCVRLTDEGRVVDRIHEVSGWKLADKKHGLAARFTADGEYVILTPAFRSGGRPTVLRLSDGEVLTPRFPRGWAKAEILDHHPARGWWLRKDNDVTVVPSLV